MHQIFVFGTLKRGFPLHASLGEARFCGWGCTAEPFPMFVAGSVFGPMMLDRPGRGLRVYGEVYAVTPDDLAEADKAENVGTPGNFRRQIEIIRSGGRRLQALAYFKHPRLARPRHGGYLHLYEDRRFQPPRQRRSSLPPMRLLSNIRIPE